MVGFTDAFAFIPQKFLGMIRLLSDHPSSLGFLVFKGARLKQDPKAPHILQISSEPGLPPMPVMIMDTAQVTHKTMTKRVSYSAGKGEFLRVTALINNTLHVLSNARQDREPIKFDLQSRQVIFNH